jgi:hypothetical protein
VWSRLTDRNEDQINNDVGNPNPPRGDVIVAENSNVLAFPTSRDTWDQLPGVPSQLAAVDELLRRRSDGNFRIPTRRRWRDGEALTLAIRALEAWANGEPPVDPATRPELARRIFGLLQPALEAVVWPRWLLLERALHDGSASGDLLFSVLALRAMCEEVQWLHALDLTADQIASMAASSAPADQERLNLIFFGRLGQPR